MKVLTLTINKKWFDLIKSGKKTNEWREVKPYWEARLENKKYDVVIFRNGYLKTSPTATFKLLGIGKKLRSNKMYYVLRLGRQV